MNECGTQALRHRVEFHCAIVSYCETVLGADHWLTLRERQLYAIAQFEAGDQEIATRQLADLALLCGRVLGAGHRLTLHARYVVDQCLKECDRFDEVAPVSEDDVRLYSAEFGRYGDITLNIRFDYANRLYVEGRYEQCLGLFRQLMIDCRPFREPDSIQTFLMRHYVVQCLLELGRAEEAVSECEIHVCEAEQYYGADNNDTCEARWLLIACLMQAEQLETALQQSRLLVRETEAMFGRVDRRTIVVRSQLADCLIWARGDHVAVEILRESVVDAAGLADKDEDVVLWVKSNLSECLTRIGQYAEALEVCKDLSALLERSEEAGTEMASQLREREMQCWIGLRDQ